MMTDPLADMLTRIRNAVRVERPYVDVPASQLKIGVAEALRAEGYIHGYEVGTIETGEDGVPHFQPQVDRTRPKLLLRIVLKYGPEGEKVIQHLERVSRPGRRIYRSYKELRPVLDGLGIAVLSTSHGVMSDRQARTRKLGGEVLCRVW
jgi:small subunit ribosomal protein S8